MNLPLLKPCLCCGCGAGHPHEEDCLVAEHEAALAGDPLAQAVHDPDECYQCLLTREVVNTCRCALCCRRLIIEVELQDAEREPKIKEKGSPLFTPPELTGTGQRELEGYLLNGKDVACVFLDQQTNACTIYETRPLACRLFDCDGDGRQQLIGLGIIPAVTNGEEKEGGT